jgi:hypothetical protein
MDVVNAISCMFLFMAAGPFLEKLFLTSASKNILQRPHEKEPTQAGSVIGPFSAGVDFTRNSRERPLRNSPSRHSNL